jgi:NADH dehydrogenase [ubiquinone] 1 alpha subcomplex assembly factor 7
MTVALIKRGDESPDPLREALAVSIAAERKARAALDAAAEDLARSRTLAAEADAEVEAKTAAIGEAREQDAAAARAVRTRVSAAGTGAVKKARRDLEDSQDARDVAVSLVGRIEEELAAGEAAASRAASAVIEARNKLVAPLAERLLERARAAKMTMAIAEAQVAAMLFTGDDSLALSDAKAALGRFRGSGNADTFQPAKAAEQAMREAIGRLTADASVELPELG